MKTRTTLYGTQGDDYLIGISQMEDAGWAVRQIVPIQSSGYVYDDYDRAIPQLNTHQVLVVFEWPS